MTFGERLREERKAAGMSRCELARLAKLSDVTVLEYERGQIGVINSGASRLAAALGFGVSDLLDPPRLYDVSFAVTSAGAGVDELAQVIDACGRRVRPWPRVDDGHLRIRACGSSLPDVVALSEAVGVGPACVVTVSPSTSLAVLVEASGATEARRVVLGAATRAECCPPVEVQRSGARWIARLRHVPEQCSMVLQRLAPRSPLGLFHPE